jgi:hypothetical protein
MHHTKTHAEKHGRSVLARLLKRHGAIQRNGNIFYNAQESVNMGPRRVNMLRRQINAAPPTRYNLLLKRVNESNNNKKQHKENEASAFRRVLANVRARLRGTGKKLY